MGGLISRYALAFMEKKLAETGNATKWDHNTRLWVSFDSPHQGANIPIGVQKGIQYFAEVLDNESAKKFINEELNKPAPKQMLVNHYTNNTSFPVGAPNFRNRFQNSLDNLDMPQNLRKIALLNGSMNGLLNGVSSAKYLQINTRIPLFGFLSPTISNKFYHNTNEKSGNNNFIVFDGQGLKLNFLLFSITIIKDKKCYSKPSSIGSYDIAPGGYFGAHTILANESNSDSHWSAWGINLVHTLSTRSTIYDQTHSFIPTKSSLAYTGSNVLDENIGNENRVCTGETPFDSYFAPQDNQEHIFLTTDNVSWLTNEIEGIFQQPIVSITSSDLRGNARLCNTVSSYSFDACQFKVDRWQVSSNLEKVWSNTTQINIKPKEGVMQGDGIVTAYNGDTFVTKQIPIGYHVFSHITETSVNEFNPVTPYIPIEVLMLD